MLYCDLFYILVTRHQLLKPTTYYGLQCILFFVFGIFFIPIN